jgi:cytidylate kinase
MKNIEFDKVIAIDGPSGSGKSTVARDLANNLGVLYIDTGAMFRALAYECHERHIEFIDSDILKSFLKNIDFKYGVSSEILIQIDGKDLTDKIREHHVSKLASVISQLPSVRTYLLEFQRHLASNRVCVMEGRDIGTVVFPNAFSKFFVTASAEIRASRRLKQLRENGDQSVSLEQVINDVKKRDDTDMNRPVAPLKKAEDAMLLDTTDMSLVDIVSVLSREVKFRAGHLGFNL